MTSLRVTALLVLAAMLSACNAVLLDPSGDMALQESKLVLLSTFVMFLIVGPVMVLSVWFAWHYRASNTSARYEPNWHHSTVIELVTWGVSIVAILYLGSVVWKQTHLLDPYRPVSRIAEGKPVPVGVKPLQVDVVALDWKWLFIYPEYNIATVNDLAAPLERPIEFKITASTVMNAFYIPAIAGQVWAMPGMQTMLHAVVNRPGNFFGFSSQYSGSGFSGMHFLMHGMSSSDFDKWVADARAKGAGKVLNRDSYLELAKPSENVPPQQFVFSDPKLFGDIVEMCVKPGSVCLSKLKTAGTTEPAGAGVAANCQTKPPVSNL